MLDRWSVMVLSMSNKNKHCMMGTIIYGSTCIRGGRLL